MRCANPACRAESLYFRSGSLYWINFMNPKDPCAGDEGAQKLIWLCSDCSSQFIVQTWRPPGQQIRQRSKEAGVQTNGSSRSMSWGNSQQQYAKAS